MDHARSFDLLQSPTVAPAWPEHFCDRGSEDRRAMVWLWAGAPIGSEGGSGSLQDSAEYTNRSRQPWSTTKEGRRRLAECLAQIARQTRFHHWFGPGWWPTGIVRRTLDIDGPVRGCLDVPAVPAPMAFWSKQALLARGQLGQNPFPTLGSSPIRLGCFKQCFHSIRRENAKRSLRIPVKVYQLLIKSTNCWKGRG